MAEKLNRTSRRITQPKSQGASQAMLYATGLSEADMEKAQVGIASVWFEGNPCNMHLQDLAAKVKEGVMAAGLIGMRFNTIGVSDGISMGTEGMSFSLQSRDLIADCIETVMGAQWYDANISLPGCDKNMPGCLIAMARVGRPALMVYGGTIRPGRGRTGDPLDIVSAFQSYGEFIAGRIDRRRSPRHRALRLPRRGRLRWHVHGEHHGRGHRSAGHVAARQLVHAGRGSGQARGVHARGRRDPRAARARNPPARRDDARGLWQRNGGRDGAGRLDQRRAAPDRDGARGGGAARSRRFPAHQRPRAVPRRAQALGALRDGGPAHASAVRPRCCACCSSTTRSMAIVSRAPATRWPEFRRSGRISPTDRPCRPCDAPIKATGHLRILREPGAGQRRRQAHRRGRLGFARTARVFDCRRPCSPHPQAVSHAAAWSSFARGAEGRTWHARDAARPPRRRRPAGRCCRAHHRWPL